MLIDLVGMDRGSAGWTCSPLPAQLPLLAAKVRNTLIEQLLTLIKQSPTHTEFVMLIFK